jgi:hypothetical protein
MSKNFYPFEEPTYNELETMGVYSDQENVSTSVAQEYQSINLEVPWFLRFAPVFSYDNEDDVVDAAQVHVYPPGANCTLGAESPCPCYLPCHQP